MSKYQVKVIVFCEVEDVEDEAEAVFSAITHLTAINMNNVSIKGSDVYQCTKVRDDDSETPDQIDPG